MASEDVVLMLPYCPGMWPWASPFASLGLSFPISKQKKLSFDLQGGGRLCFLSACQEPSTPCQSFQANCVLESQTLTLLQNHVQSGKFNPLRAGMGGTGGVPVSSK